MLSSSWFATFQSCLPKCSFFPICQASTCQVRSSKALYFRHRLGTGKPCFYCYTAMLVSVCACLKGCSEPFSALFVCFFVVCWQTRLVVSIRDLLSWVNFINAYCDQQRLHGTCGDLNVCAAEAYINGACLVLLDSLGSGQASLASLTAKTTTSVPLRQHCLAFLTNQVQHWLSGSPFLQNVLNETPAGGFLSGSFCGFSPFLIPQGQ